MAVTVYQSTDVDAPALSGTVGTLINVLDAVLVNGYGSKAAAGWAKSFSGTNKAVYRPALGNRYYLRVDDSGVLVNAANAHARGYETMSDVDTGTNPFPTSLAVANGATFGKSNAISAAARHWIIIATPTFFYLLINTQETVYSAGWFYGNCFGDFYSYKRIPDPYATLVIGNVLCASPTSYYILQYGASYVNGHLARKFDGISVNNNGMAILAMSRLAETYNYGYQYEAIGGYTPGVIYPDPISGRLWLTPYYVIESNHVLATTTGQLVRGWLPGLWGPCHLMPLKHGDIVNGAANTNLAGKTFMVINIHAGAAADGATGQALFEISDTWLDIVFN